MTATAAALASLPLAINAFPCSFSILHMTVRMIFANHQWNVPLLCLNPPGVLQERHQCLLCPGWLTGSQATWIWFSPSVHITAPLSAPCLLHCAPGTAFRLLRHVVTALFPFLYALPCAWKASCPLFPLHLANSYSSFTTISLSSPRWSFLDCVSLSKYLLLSVEMVGVQSVLPYQNMDRLLEGRKRNLVCSLSGASLR